MNQRQCTTCGETKPYDKFSWDKRRNIPRSKCKECANKYYYEYSKKEKPNKKEKDLFCKNKNFLKNMMVKLTDEQRIEFVSIFGFIQEIKKTEFKSAIEFAKKYIEVKK